MNPFKTSPNTSSSWVQKQFRRCRGSVAFIETSGDEGDLGIGTCFHVGDGIFVTASHVIKNRIITKIGLDDGLATIQLLEEPEHWGQKSHGAVTILEGPFFHPDSSVDVACFKCEPYPQSWIPLGGHLNNWLGQYELVLHQVLLLGYSRSGADGSTMNQIAAVPQKRYALRLRERHD